MITNLVLTLRLVLVHIDLGKVGLICDRRPHPEAPLRHPQVPSPRKAGVHRNNPVVPRHTALLVRITPKKRGLLPLEKPGRRQLKPLCAPEKSTQEKHHHAKLAPHLAAQQHNGTRITRPGRQSLCLHKDLSSVENTICTCPRQGSESIVTHHPTIDVVGRILPRQPRTQSCLGPSPPRGPA